MELLLVPIVAIISMVALGFVIVIARMFYIGLCPLCKKEIPRSASVCSHCGRDVNWD